MVLTDHQAAGLHALENTSKTVTSTGGKNLLILYLVFAATIRHKIQIDIRDDSGWNFSRLPMMESGRTEHVRLFGRQKTRDQRQCA
jgi:hypothetical protein